MAASTAGRGLLARLRSESPSQGLNEQAAIAVHLRELLNCKTLPELDTSPLLGLMQSCPRQRLAWEHRLRAQLMHYEHRLCQLRLRSELPAAPFPLALHIFAQLRSAPSQSLYLIAAVNRQDRFFISNHADDAIS